MPVDDDVVHMWIHTALSVMNNKVEPAFEYLRDMRHLKDPDNEDDDLAAAEHYMYTRWLVGSGRRTANQMRANNVLYDYAKVEAFRIPGVRGALGLMGHTWSSPSFDSMKWSFRGIDDGETDRNKPGHQDDTDDD